MCLEGPHHLPSAWPCGKLGLGGLGEALAGWGIPAHGTLRPTLPAVAWKILTPHCSQFLFFYFEFVFGDWREERQLLVVLMF